MFRLMLSGLVLACACATAAADTLILRDGRKVSGAVVEGDGVYVVERDGRKTRVPEQLVAEWVMGDSADDGKPADAGLANDFAKEMEAAAAKLADAPVANGDATTTDAVTTGDVDTGEPTAVGDAPPVEVTTVDAPPVEGALGDVNASIDRSGPAAAVGRRVVAVAECAVAFPVSAELLVTSARVAVGGADAQLLTRDAEPVEFDIVRHDAKLGLALLRVKGKRLHALRLADAMPAGGAAVTVCGYTEGTLFQPVLEAIGAKAANPSATWQVAATKNPVSPGGPILCDGKVVGVHLATIDARPDAIPAVTLEQLRKFLGKDAAPGTGASPDPATVAMQLSATHEREAKAE